MAVFYVEVVSEEIAECLVKLAKKNGYEFIDNLDNYEPYLCFYKEGGPGDIHFLTFREPEKTLHGINDFAEIVRRLEERLPKRVKLGNCEGEISPDGETLVANCQKIAFNEVKEAYITMVALRKGLTR